MTNPDDPLPDTRSEPGLPAPSDQSALMQRLSDGSRNAFRRLNAHLMVPAHRAGLAAWLGNPATGWQLLVTTTGRKSGLRRPTPLGYLVAEGAAWVMAGYGQSTHWYQNLLAQPRVEVLMPARAPFVATAEAVTDPAVRARIIPALARSMAIPGSMIGALPATTPDERILELTNWVPLVALKPVGEPLVGGPDDPGGHGWVPRQVGMAVAGLVVIRAVIGILRRDHRRR